MSYTCCGLTGVVQMPGRHVCSPNTGPCFREIPGSGWRHCLLLGQTRWAGCLLHTSEVSPVTFTAPLTLLFSTNSMTSLTPFQSNCKAQLMANTSHRHLLSPDFAPVWHPLPGINRSCELWETLRIFVVDLCVHSLAYHDRQQQLLEYAVHSDDETWLAWFTQASAAESQEVPPCGFSGDLTLEAWRPLRL